MSQLFASDDQNTGVSFNISASNEYSGLISLKIDWFDLWTVKKAEHQRTDAFDLGAVEDSCGESLGQQGEQTNQLVNSQHLFIIYCIPSPVSDLLC